MEHLLGGMRSSLLCCLIAAVLRMSAEWGEKKKSLVRKPLQHIRLLSSHIHARSGTLMLPLSASDPTLCGRPQTATIWCGLYFLEGGASFSICQLPLTQAESCSLSMQSVTLLTPAGALGSNKVPPLLSSAIRLDALLRGRGASRSSAKCESVMFLRCPFLLHAASAGICVVFFVDPTSHIYHS